MKQVLTKKDREESSAPAPADTEMRGEENQAWALKWDGAALAAVQGKKENPDKWDRP